ncbi:MAG: hypothetical protein OEX98_07110 [Nitrosopumilus sp.]|nr:hypothetical protein [Nitrosopumilus sp.]
MNEQEQLMGDLLNVDLEIIDVVIEFNLGHWTSDSKRSRWRFT